MADLVIEFTPEVLRNNAATLNTSAANIDTLLNEVTKEVQSLAASWIGSASENYINKFNGLNDDFTKIVKDIKDYAAFLNKAADDYTQTQNQVQSAEDMLKS